MKKTNSFAENLIKGIVYTLLITVAAYAIAVVGTILLRTMVVLTPALIAVLPFIGILVVSGLVYAYNKTKKQDEMNKSSEVEAEETP